MPKDPQKKAPQTKVMTVSEFARLGGLKGGKARMAQLSAEERSALASKAGKKSGSSMTKAERSERARKAVLARWAKKNVRD